MYLPNIWDNDYDYQQTLIDANDYFETSPREAKKSTKSKAGKIKVSESCIFSTWN
jgi:hypothetical protein